MRTKKVNRYYCDFCKKSGCSGGHIKRHEKRCTMNPARECGMCKMLGQEPPDLQSLIALLPTVETQRRKDYSDDGRNSYDYFICIDEASQKALREASGACPACMMAAIRQRGLPVGTADKFNFSQECRSIWSDINASQRD